MLSLKAIAAGSIVAGGLSMVAGGIAPTANAVPSSPVISGPQWLSENNGPGRGRGHDKHDDDWGRWDGPRIWDPIDACFKASGPFGFAAGSVCI
jgi:hypothetical protein